MAGAALAGAATVAVDPAEQFRSLLLGHQRFDAVAPREDADTTVILYTSGTTGQPKGAELQLRQSGTKTSTSWSKA